jgi:hypothetical protein
MVPVACPVVRTNKYYVIVMECMNGGELFDRIVDRQKYNENDAKVRSQVTQAHIFFIFAPINKYISTIPPTDVFSDAARNRSWWQLAFSMPSVISTPTT